MSLTIELIMSAVLLTVVTIIHGTGISAMDRIFRTAQRDLRALKLATREFGVMVPMALLLLALHVVEIFVFAFFYLATDDAPNLRMAVYHSALAYTTMGVTEGGPTKWMILSTFEGLCGFLMIGWSSAVFVTDMDRVLRGRGPVRSGD